MNFAKEYLESSHKIESWKDLLNVESVAAIDFDGWVRAMTLQIHWVLDYYCCSIVDCESVVQSQKEEFC